MNESKKSRHNTRQWEIWKRVGAVWGDPPHALVDGCDTLAGIRERIGSLKDLNRLVITREKMHAHGLRLHDWVVFGKLLLEADGTASAIVGPPMADGPDEPVPTVIPLEEFYARLKVRAPGWDGWYRTKPLDKSGATIPRPWERCTFCRQPWTMETFLDCDQAFTELVVPGTPFVGQTLDQVRKAYRRRQDARYAIHSERVIRNDDLIDLRPDPNAPDLARNEHGWTVARLVPGTYVIRPGDEILVARYDQAHLACRVGHLAQAIETAFRQAFERAGYDGPSLRFTRLPNPYAPGKERWHGPGFAVETSSGDIRINWRAHVIDIQWAATGRDLAHLFADVVTLSKGPHYIHADGYAQATDFLARLRGALVPPPALQRAG